MPQYTTYQTWGLVQEVIQVKNCFNISLKTLDIQLGEGKQEAWNFPSGEERVDTKIGFSRKHDTGKWSVFLSELMKKWSVAMVVYYTLNILLYVQWASQKNYLWYLVVTYMC
jgi:hypothetical protein